MLQLAQRIYNLLDEIKQESDPVSYTHLLIAYADYVFLNKSEKKNLGFNARSDVYSKPGSMLTFIDVYKRQVQRTDIQRGQCLVKPGSVKCHKKFTAQVYVLTKDEGGRHTPFFNN